MSLVGQNPSWTIRRPSALDPKRTPCSPPFVGASRAILLRPNASPKVKGSQTAGAKASDLRFVAEGYAEIYFWDESGYRADAVKRTTWGVKGETPVVEVPGKRQSISAASAVNSKGAFWFATYQGGISAELFVAMLKLIMRGRRKPLYLVLDTLPARKAKVVRDYVEATNGKLKLFFLPGYAPELNPDELVWSYVKRTGTAEFKV
jgi:transposase